MTRSAAEPRDVARAGRVLRLANFDSLRLSFAALARTHGLEPQPRADAHLSARASNKIERSAP